MIQAIDLTVEFDRLHGPIFSNAYLSIQRGDKVALVGPNGCGKSTLLLALARELTPTRGSVRWDRRAHVARLPQDLLALEAPEDRPELRRALYRLGSSPELLRRDPESLSPGERMRIALGGVLAEEPDILLLDEPTNHLDMPGRRWLEEFLWTCSEGVLAVTHDRAFADAFASRTLEIEQGVLREYDGGYSRMLQWKGHRQKEEMAAFERKQHEVRRLKNSAERTLQRASDMTVVPKGVNPGKSKPYYAGLQKKLDRRAKAIQKRAAQVQAIELHKPFVADALHLDLNARPLRAHFALQARGLTKRIGGRTLFEEIGFDVEAGQRAAIVGPNGAGKTTMLRGLLNPETLDAGEVSWAPGAHAAELSQIRTLGDRSLTIIESLEGLDQQRARDLLARLGLRAEALHKQVGVLSVGERTRVELVRMLFGEANVLLLDEPTNHLDLPSLQALEEALSMFTGSVVFVSHDLRFVERLAHDVIRLGEIESK